MRKDKIDAARAQPWMFAKSASVDETSEVDVLIAGSVALRARCGRIAKPKRRASRRVLGVKS